MRTRKESILDCIKDEAKSKRDIASELGMTVPSINRHMGELFKENKIRTFETQYRWKLFRAQNHD